MLCRLNCSVLLSLLLISVSSADIFLPSGLNPGDKYRIVFVTSTTRNALSSNINDYNTFVNTAANALGTQTAALNTTWTAIASTPTVDARDNTGTNPASLGVPIFLVDGSTQIAEDNIDLWSGDVSAPIDINEFGITVAPTRVWTGSDSNGFGEFERELGTTEEGSIVGATGSTNGSWIDDTTRLKTELYPLYGISVELMAIPEPGAFGFLGLFGLGFGGLRRARRARKN